MSTAKVEIYTRMMCGYCTRAKQLLDTKGVDYVEYDVTMGGADKRTMLERKPDARTVWIGDVLIRAGATGTDTFEVTFHGRGGHGARPQDTIDPVIGLGAFIMEVQTLVSRRLDPGLPGVVTVGVPHDKKGDAAIDGGELYDSTR